MSADPRDWRLGLHYAAMALDAVGLDLYGNRLRDALTPREGAAFACEAGTACLGAAMAGHRLHDDMRAESDAAMVDWRREQRKEWAFGGSLLATRMGRPRDACRLAEALCWAANRDRSIVRAAEEAAGLDQ